MVHCPPGKKLPVRLCLSYLQNMQNTAARFISQTREYDHIKPVMKDLHWLPIRSRIEFKILIMVYKSLHGRTSLYLRELLCRRPDRGTRQDGKNNPLVPKAKWTTFGARTFQYGGPKLWNSLPNDLKNLSGLDIFKKILKTFLFKKSCDSLIVFISYMYIFYTS